MPFEDWSTHEETETNPVETTPEVEVSEPTPVEETTAVVEPEKPAKPKGKKVKAEPKEEPKEEFFTVHINSQGIETYTVKRGGKQVKVIRGWLNGEKFEVECNKTVEVPAEIYGIIKPIVDAQQGIRYKGIVE